MHQVHSSIILIEMELLKNQELRKEILTAYHYAIGREYSQNITMLLEGNTHSISLCYWKGILTAHQYSQHITMLLKGNTHSISLSIGSA